MDSVTTEVLEPGKLAPEQWAAVVHDVLAAQPELAAVTVQAMQAGILASNDRLRDRLATVSMGLHHALSTKRGQVRRDPDVVVSAIKASVLDGTPWADETIAKEQG